MDLWSVARMSIMYVAGGMDLWICGENVYHVCSKRCRSVVCGQNVYHVCSRECQPVDLWAVNKMSILYVEEGESTKH